MCRRTNTGFYSPIANFSIPSILRRTENCLCRHDALDLDGDVYFTPTYKFAHFQLHVNCHFLLSSNELISFFFIIVFNWGRINTKEYPTLRPNGSLQLAICTKKKFQVIEK